MAPWESGQPWEPSGYRLGAAVPGVGLGCSGDWLNLLGTWLL